MTKIFLISGMGADTRLYNHIDIPEGYDVIPVDWIEHHETDTLTTYAQKLIYQYDIRPKSIVIGNSLGGMLAIEIAKKVGVEKTILMSSIKIINEAPAYFKFFRAIPVYKLFSNGLLDMGKYMVNSVLGKGDKEGAWLFRDMYEKTSKSFLRWSMGAALHWDNTVLPPNVFHIHGDKDLVFNYKNVKDAVIVKSGTHIMVYDKAKEINKWLKQVLKK